MGAYKGNGNFGVEEGQPVRLLGLLQILRGLDYSFLDHKTLVNIRESEKAINIEIAVPGRTKEDFNIEVVNRVLIISTQAIKDESNVKRHLRQEFKDMAFTKSFPLPYSILEDKIEAYYSQGVLTITLPKNGHSGLSNKQTVKVR